MNHSEAKDKEKVSSSKAGRELYDNLSKTLETEEEEEESELTNALVLRREISWEALRGAEIISEQELTYIKNFDKKPSEERESLLDEVSISIAKPKKKIVC